MSASHDSSLAYRLHIGDVSYSFDDVTIENSPTPVNAPTTRGGVYFSDTFAYKVKGIIRDLSVVPLLSKTMLGPNTDFGEIKITTSFVLDGKTKNFTLYTNLTNSMQNPSQIELNMILIKLESD